MKRTPKPEWSFKIEAERIGPTPAAYDIRPNPEEAEALAARFKLEALEDLSAHLTLTRERGFVIHVAGKMTARVVQPCVVTADEVATTIDEAFEAYFSDKGNTIPFARARADLQAKQGGEDVEMEMLDERDAPEPVDADGTIDLGELTSQYLSLAIPAYPRAPHAPAPVEAPEREGDGDEVKGISPLTGAENPFASLKDWKDKL